MLTRLLSNYNSLQCILLFQKYKYLCNRKNIFLLFVYLLLETTCINYNRQITYAYQLGFIFLSEKLVAMWITNIEYASEIADSRYVSEAVRFVLVNYGTTRIECFIKSHNSEVFGVPTS